MVKRSSLRILWYAFCGWGFGTILMHVFRPDRLNEGALLGLALGLLWYAIRVLWICLSCHPEPASPPCTNCPSKGRWNRFCQNHGLAASLLVLVVGFFCFIGAHFVIFLLGLTAWEFFDHSIKFISWIAAGLAAFVGLVFDRLRHLI